MIRRIVALGLMALLLSAVEAGLIFALGFPRSGLHLSLGVLLLAAARAGDIDGAVIAAIVGYGWDLFSGAPLGLSIAPAVGVFVMVRLLSQGVDIAGFLQLIVLGMLSAIAHAVACVVILALTARTADLALGYVSSVSLRQAFLASLAVPFVFAAARRLDRWLVKDRADGEVWLT